MACCLVLIPRCQVVGEADREKHPAVWHAGGSGQSGSYDGSERREKRLGSQPSLGEGLPGKCKNHSSNKINPGYLCCFSAHRVRIGRKIICFGIYFDLWKTLDLFYLYLSKKIGHLRYEIFHKFVSIHLNMQRWGNTRTHTYMEIGAPKVCLKDADFSAVSNEYSCGEYLGASDQWNTIMGGKTE